MKINHLISINIVSAAAARAHDQKFRKDGNTPYIVHPARVATLAKHFGGDHIAIIAAWVHDVFEDCNSDICNEVKSIIHKLPLQREDIAKIHEVITALTKKNDIPKDEQMTESLNRILNAPQEAVLIKICDRIDNLIDAQGRDKEFKIKYYKEAEVIGKILGTKAINSGYSTALESLWIIIREYYHTEDPENHSLTQ
jgi:guanosine-3',5'-bis(diphosphate) 3'-pyrophosphohydrolase